MRKEMASDKIIAQYTNGLCKILASTPEIGSDQNVWPFANKVLRHPCLSPSHYSKIIKTHRGPSDSGAITKMEGQHPVQKSLSPSYAVKTGITATLETDQ